MLNILASGTLVADPKRCTSAARKVVWAESISALYSREKVRHVGKFIDLEDELSAFSTVGYLGGRGPNRADAFVFAMAELFPDVVSGPRVPRGAIDQNRKSPM